MTEKKFTGWHMLTITVTGFAIIIGVNLTLAFNAVATFPGLETKNSYVASQKFHAEQTAQTALGWDTTAEINDGLLTLAIRDAAGKPVRPEVKSAILGRATHVNDDSIPEFRWTGTMLEAPTTANDGYWNLRVVLVAENGTEFRQRIPVTAQR